jgi:acetyltransferase-like isoleucine patch superfamily enzyme
MLNLALLLKTMYRSVHTVPFTPISTIDDKSGPVLLKENCRIGSHSTIMPGVTIGKNAVIGAHSFVNSDIPDNALAVGVPAMIKKVL